MALFDANAPAYFAHNEREDYEQFLADAPAYYRVCVQDGKVVGAYGLAPEAESSRARIRWIMTAAAQRGAGVGRYMMRQMLAQAAVAEIAILDIAASQKSASFFARYGAVVREQKPEGWGPGLDLVIMELPLDAPFDVCGERWRDAALPR